MSKATIGNIYRADCIHGNEATELAPEMYFTWGVALASALPAGAKFLVAYDVRERSSLFAESLLSGLTQGGAEPVNLGQVPTPMAYFAMLRTQGDGYAVVTGGAAPAGENGLYWRLNRSAEEQVSPQYLATFVPQPLQKAVPARSLDISFDYVACFQQVWFDVPHESLQVVIDPMYGSWAGKARRYLQATFPWMVFSAINDTPDPCFGNSAPNMRATGALLPLSREVDRLRADLGCLLEADTPTVTFVDGNGVPLLQEEAAWLLLDTLGDSIRGEIVLHDAGCSRLLLQRLKELGAVLQCAPHGADAFWLAMNETGACFGFGSGGHFHFRSLRGNAAPLFTICWLLDHLIAQKQRGISLLQWRSTIPPFIITPELEFSMPDMKPLLDSLLRHLNTPPVCDTEGVRFSTDDGWVYLRDPASFGTSSLRIEGTSRRHFDALLRRTAAAFDDAGCSSVKISPVYF